MQVERTLITFLWEQTWDISPSSFSFFGGQKSKYHSNKVPLGLVEKCYNSIIHFVLPFSHIKLNFNYYNFFAYCKNYVFKGSFIAVLVNILLSKITAQIVFHTRRLAKLFCDLVCYIDCKSNCNLKNSTKTPKFC
jgi:hypothetical protein